jgi:hypothetical protein
VLTPAKKLQLKQHNEMEKTLKIVENFATHKDQPCTSTSIGSNSCENNSVLPKPIEKSTPTPSKVIIIFK